RGRAAARVSRDHRRFRHAALCLPRLGRPGARQALDAADGRAGAAADQRRDRGLSHRPTAVIASEAKQSSVARRVSVASARLLDPSELLWIKSRQGHHRLGSAVMGAKPSTLAGDFWGGLAAMLVALPSA